MLGAAAATGFTPYWLVAVAALAAALGVKRFSAGILIAVAAAVVLSAWLPFRGNEYRRLLPGRDVGGEFRFRLDDPALTRTPGISPPRLVRAELLGFRLRGERDFRECGGRFFAIFPTGVRTPDFGALVTAEGVFALPDSGNEEFRNFNFRTYLEARGADRLLRIDDFQVAGRAPGWYGKLLDFRDLLLTRLLSGVDSDTVRNLAAALYFGVDGGVSGSGRELFVASGTIHLFSVSGMHVGVLALLFWLVSSPLRFEWRWPLVVAALAAYVLGTGANPPALRAFLMIAAWALLRSRLFYSPPLNVMSAVAAILLIWNPWLIADLGAWYSFLVTGALLLAAERLTELRQLMLEPLRLMPRGGKSWSRAGELRRESALLLAPGGCLAAFAGGAGLSLFSRGTLPAGTIPANLLLLPLVPILFLLVPVKLLLPVGSGGWLLEYAFGVLTAIAGWSGEIFGSLSPGRPGVPELVIYYLLLFGALGGVAARFRPVLWLLLGVSVACWIGFGEWRRPALLVVSGGSGTPPTVAWTDPASGYSALVNLPDAAAADAVEWFFSSRGTAVPEAFISTCPRRGMASGLASLQRRMAPIRIVLPEIDRYSGSFLSLFEVDCGRFDAVPAKLGRESLIGSGDGSSKEFPLHIRERDGRFELFIEAAESGRRVRLLRPGHPEHRLLLPWREPAGVRVVEF